MLMPDGRILIVGGPHGIPSGMRTVKEAELFDPYKHAWKTAGAMSVSRAQFTLTLLPSGQVLAAGGFTGGWGDCRQLGSAELYKPGVGWQGTGSMVTGRSGHAAVVLPSGDVLVMGGGDCSGNVFASAELYEP